MRRTSITLTRRSATAKAIAHTDYEFDENGEVKLTMEFYDGIAYDVNGSGLVMTYPTAEKVQKFTILQNCIISYTGIDDGYIYQKDIALKYGKLEWRDSDCSDAWNKTFSMKEFNSFAETLATISGDIYNKVYSVIGDYQTTAQKITDLALEFEKWWNENADEDTDFIEVLEDFEEKALDELGYDPDDVHLDETDFDELPDDDDDPNPYQYIIDHCNKVAADALALANSILQKTT